MRRFFATLFLIAAIVTTTAHAQWDMEESNTTASLRGIHNVGGGVAWASGTNGTIIRTEDGGYLWQNCTIPPGAEHLDFRGIQAFDENTVIVMSSGKGDLSRIYKTIDGCLTWKLVFTNPDKEGFFDAMQFETSQRGWLLGDPVNHRFVLRATFDGGVHWQSVDAAGLGEATPAGGAFAASNSLILLSFPVIFATSHGWLYRGKSTCTMGLLQHDPKSCLPLLEFKKERLPVADGSVAAGIFSIAKRNEVEVSAGGDYKQPENTQGTVAYTLDSGAHWSPAAIPPHGYRSSIAYDATTKAFITVGPNGGDYSLDNGRTWHPLGTDPKIAANWNALSLPFVVGPNGRVAKLRDDAIKH